jgi:hypothetical protein
VSVYFGLSSGLKLLDVSFFSLQLQSNAFTKCVVTVSATRGGNSYGGGVSVYIGGYASVVSAGNAVAAVGGTMVRNVSVAMSAAEFESCGAIRLFIDVINGRNPSGNSCGGSFSFYIGAYAWSLSTTGSSSSSCDATNASDVNVSISDLRCFNCVAATTDFTSTFSVGANSYGGSISSLHVGAYAWSLSNAGSSSSCDATNAIGLRVNISNAPCTNCTASTAASDSRFGTSGHLGSISYGGSINALDVGAYSWSSGRGSGIGLTFVRSSCGSLTASDLNVIISNAPCFNCVATSTGIVQGGNSFGGSISALHVGANAWSQNGERSGFSISSCNTTTASGLSVSISNASCSNCIASTTGDLGTNAYGGSISAVHVGAYAWGTGVSSCGATNASGLSVTISNSSCINCTAPNFNENSFAISLGTNAYGGSISALHVGAYAWSLTILGTCRSSCDATTASNLSVTISNAPCSNCVASTTHSRFSFGANSYGGSINAVHVGAYAWSRSQTGESDSISSTAETILSGLSVSISNAPCSNCVTSTTHSQDSNGANSYGGSISALHVGAYSWSMSNGRQSISTTRQTILSGLSVSINNAPCSNCVASTTTSGFSSGANSYGGSISALHVGAYAWSRTDARLPPSSPVQFAFQAFALLEITVVQNSRIVLSSSKFENCRAVSSTSGDSGSLGSSFVFGGAVSILQLPQAFSESQFRRPPSAGIVMGSNVTVVISDSNFSECFASTSPSSARPGAANGGGGAVYASSAALTNFTVAACNFSSSYVTVSGGSVGVNAVPAYSVGGAVAVEVQSLNVVFVAVSACKFSKCFTRGARIPSIAVRGGAVAVSRATYVVVSNSEFISCAIEGALPNDDIDRTVISGGAGVSITLAANVSVEGCNFSADNNLDSSGTSTGLLVLASNFSRSRVNVADTTFKSSAVVFSVSCVDDAGVRSVACSPLSQSLHVSNSTIFQQSSSPTSLISLRTEVSSSFSKFRMQCLTGNAVFIRNLPNAPSHTYSCEVCPILEISLSGSSVLLENLQHTTIFGRCIKSPSASQCPFGISDCSTFVIVASGFWTNFTNASTFPLNATRCPRGYCTCGSEWNAGRLQSCMLPPPLAIDRSPNSLCAPNREGKLCGGCLPNFTQSMDGRSCISNEDCLSNLWWVWTVSILGFALYSLYIVLSCGKIGDKSLSCVLFYFQISSFASDSGDSDESSSIFRISQVESLISFVSGACFAPSMSSYDATASKLIGPLFVFVFSAVWTCILRALQPRLQQRSIQIHVSYSGTLVATTLFVFSNVASVVFSLVECTSYNSDGVVFIDGTVPCLDNKWKGLMVVVVLLCLFPTAFFAALRLNKLPEDARAVVCGAFTEPMFYWGALTLEFRLLISVMQFLEVGYPTLLAFMRVMLSLGVFSLLLTLRPHIFTRTFWVDVVCYVCLIAQFSLQAFFAAMDYFAVASVTFTTQQKEFYGSMLAMTSMFRSSRRLLFVCKRILTQTTTGFCRLLCLPSPG